MYSDYARVFYVKTKSFAFRMDKSTLIQPFHDKHDPRFGITYDGSNISANDGDICIAFITYDILQKRKNPYCLDIGADICWWSIFCCEHFPLTRVDAFEPAPISTEFLSELTIKYPNITLHNKAISNIKGFLSLTTDGACSNTRSDGGILVESITLDSFLEASEKVDLIKIDTEGHELQILETLTKYSEKLDSIIFEFTPHWYGEELYETLEKTLSILNTLINTLPYIYIVSRRGPPILKLLESEELAPFTRHAFQTKYQCDLLFTKEPFSFINS